MMKLPFVSRKKYEEILNELKSEHMDLMGELTILKEDLKERNQELDLTTQYNDIATNKICELNTKLVAATTKNGELETKIKELDEKAKELEFCLEEAKKGNRKSLEIIKRTNMVKKLLINLVTLKDVQGRVLIKDGSVLTHNKVEANKVYDIVRLLG